MISTVTVLAYCFQKPDKFASAFAGVERAIRETWRHCGMLKTVLVVNAENDVARKFAAEFPNVDVQVEPTLVPGDIDSMSVDCNSRLHERFSTPYVLIVQADGYPVRSGLDEFVGKFDFIGAPYVRDSWWRNMLCKWTNCWVQNGGFSLRSRRICQAAAEYWPKYAESLRGTRMVAEDLYYTQFLPLHERRYRRDFVLASNRVSLRFSFDPIVPIPPPAETPFGFHRMKITRNELTIIHRVCPVLSRNASGGYDGKLAMVEKCAASLMRALDGIDARLIVILDGCGDDYGRLFPGAEIIRTDAIGNQATFSKQIELAASAGSEYVYFSEDDYVYRADAFKSMLQAMKSGRAEFVTPLDHPDRYNGTVSEPAATSIMIAGDRHWREVGMTCLTFMTAPQYVRRYRKVLMTYCRGEQDSVMWLGITRFGVYSPSVMVRSLAAFVRRLVGGDVWFGRFIPLMAWRRHLLRFMVPGRARLWSPMPSLAQHLCTASLAPIIDK